MIGDRIKQARKAQGFTLRELSKMVGVSHTAISKYERGEMTPASDVLSEIADATKVRLDYFFRASSVQLEGVVWRRGKELSKKEARRIEANALDQVERFIELLRLYPQPPIKPFALPDLVPERIEDLEQVEDMALAVREAWGLGHNPLPALIDTLEGLGLLVLVTELGEPGRFDGLAGRVEGFPVVVVSKACSGDRQRFTVAHELGHLVLAGRLVEGVATEAACNRFAGAFLVPRSAVVMELGERRSCLAWPELYDLKHRYGLSMALWVLRAREAKVLSPSKAKHLYSELKAKGWDKQEPQNPVEPESPRLFERLVMRGVVEGLFSRSRGAELLGLPTYELDKRLMVEVA